MNRQGARAEPDSTIVEGNRLTKRTGRFFMPPPIESPNREEIALHGNGIEFRKRFIHWCCLVEFSGLCNSTAGFRLIHPALRSRSGIAID